MEVVGQEGAEAGSEEERGCMSHVAINLNVTNATNSVAFLSGRADRSSRRYNGGGGFDGKPAAESAVGLNGVARPVTIILPINTLRLATCLMMSSVLSRRKVSARQDAMTYLVG